MTKEQLKIIAYESMIKTILDGIKDGTITDIKPIQFLIEYVWNQNKGE